MENKYKLHTSNYSTHSLILQNIGKHKKVLDVGCNEGYLGALSDNSNKFYGIDYLDSAIGKAKKIYNDARVFDINSSKELPWAMRFDVIIFADVLEHLFVPERVLKYYINHYLKTEGKVIISLPNIANWTIRLSLLFGQFNYTNTGILDRTHLHFYTFKTARKFVESAGLKVVNEIGGSSIFGFVIARAPYLRSLLSHGIILVCNNKP